MKRIGLMVALFVGLYLIGRAVAEPFVIDFSDPASYRDDWGGPGLAGVLAVHCLPGILSLAAMIVAIRRRPKGHSGHNRNTEHNGYTTVDTQE